MKVFHVFKSYMILFLCNHIELIYSGYLSCYLMNIMWTNLLILNQVHIIIYNQTQLIESVHIQYESDLSINIKSSEFIIFKDIYFDDKPFQLSVSKYIESKQFHTYEKIVTHYFYDSVDLRNKNSVVIEYDSCFIYRIWFVDNKNLLLQ